MEKRFILFLLFLITSLCWAQNDEVDQLLENSLNEFKKTNLVESNRIALKALKLAKNNQYDRGIAQAHMYIAKIHNALGNNKEALTHLNHLQNTIRFKRDYILQAENARIKGRAYASLHLFDQSILEFQKQLKIAKRIENKEKQNFALLFAHENLIQVFKETKKTDSIWQHILAMEPILKQFNEQDVYYELSAMHTQIADVLIQNNKLQQAEISLQKSLKLLQKYKGLHTAFTYTSLGDLEVAKQNAHAALEYYKKGLENAKSINNFDAKKSLLKKIAYTYSDFKISSSLAKEYLITYQKLEDSVSLENSKAQSLILQQKMNETTDEVEGKFSTTLYIAIIAAAIGLLLSIVLYKKYKKYKRLTQEREIQKLYLENRIEENNFEHLIQLAKQNSPEFIILFKEFYPEFLQSLKKYDANIRSSELIFCAMTFLNFSTKDISEYTCVTVRAVQIRKNRLRKKYNIPSDVDFNIWMQNIMSNKSVV